VSLLRRDEPVATSGPSRELLVKRERLAERFTALQLDLGGAFYEMAIRDHIRNDVLIAKAAELQRVDAELTALDALIEQGGPRLTCAACGAPAAAGVPSCWRCGEPLPQP
jgi:hypothetical protein